MGSIANALVDQAGSSQPGRLRAALFMTKGQSLGGRNNDHDYILDALRTAGLDAELIDLKDLRQASEGVWYLRTETGEVAWTPPHSALMYHGAIAPPDAAKLLTAMQREGTSVVTSPNSWGLLTDKLRFADEMGARGVRVIPTERVADEGAMHAARERFGGSAVFKPAVSTEGDGVFVAGPADDLAPIATELAPGSRAIIAQPVIESRIRSGLEDGIFERIVQRTQASALARGATSEELDAIPRVLLDRRIEFRVHTIRHVDGTIEVPAIYARVGGDPDQFVNNVAQGASAHRIEFGDLDPADQRTILDAARRMPVDGDVAGWDLIGTPGQRRIIEGNSGPGLPDGSEGIHVPDVVRGYGILLRDRARQVADGHRGSRA